MISEHAPEHHYRAKLNPDFVRRVRERRREEARAAQIAAEVEKRRQAAEKEESRKAAQAMKATQAYRIIVVNEAHEGKYPARSIIERVSVAMGIPYREIVGASRMRDIAEARQVAMYEVRKLRPDLSLPQIGRIFGRDHTTVLHAVQKIGAMRAALNTSLKQNGGAE